MRKGLHQKIISHVRNITPISLRQKIGPMLAYIYYFDRLYIRSKHNKPNILSIEETVDFILEEKCSVIRFGDGEISLIDGMDLPFQKRYEKLSHELEKIIQTQNKKLLICIPGMWGNLDIFAPYAYHFIMHHMYRYHHVWEKLLIPNKIYGDTNVTRHYLAYKNKERSNIIFNKIFKIWKDNDVVLIEGEKSRLGVGNNMFTETKSLRRILCPPENAYSKYQEILNEALKINKNTLILLSLGPTAKVLAYDLFAHGYRVVDIGHIDMEYEMFLRKETKQIKVAHKYFNEINERNPIDCNDETYKKSIIITI
ncbi:MAG: SP_1767 family glycosyltransferase [Candidatus Pacebacteria bacterium]|nr:SP_1767 family glycosyltransferase [Candidatus Paceibacterota bacterium]